MEFSIAQLETNFVVNLNWLKKAEVKHWQNSTSLLKMAMGFSPEVCETKGSEWKCGTASSQTAETIIFV